MNENTLNLVSAIINKDATDIETFFNSAMAEKIAVRLDDMHAAVAQNMFAETEDITEETETLTEEEWNNLTEEEKAGYMQLDELQPLTYGSYHNLASIGQGRPGAKDRSAGIAKAHKREQDHYVHKKGPLPKLYPVGRKTKLGKKAQAAIRSDAKWNE
jgi:hypothetical protein